MKRILGKFLFVGATLLLLASGKFPPPSVGPYQPNISLGGRALAISVNPSDDNKIMVASESGGLFRSTTGGATWTQVSGSSTFWFTDVAYVPSNPNIILATAAADTRAVSGGGIWRSTGGGGVWSHLVLNLPNWCPAKSFGANALYAETARDRVWAGTGCGLAYSDDQGASWSFLATMTAPVAAVLAPTVGRLAVFVYDGVRVSTTGGNTWNVSSVGLPPMYSAVPAQHNQIAVSPVNPDHLYWAFNYAYADGWHIALVRSTDFGGKWEILFQDKNKNRPPIVRTALDANGDPERYGVYYANGSMAFVRSVAEADGSSMTSWNYMQIDHPDVGDVGFANDHKTPLLLATDGGLHQTSDFGATWTAHGAGSAGYNALQIAELTGQLHSNGSSADLYFGTQDNNFWSSPNGGALWPTAYGSEGVYLNIPLEYLPANQTKLSGSDAGAGVLFISGPQFAGATSFPSAPNLVGAPRLLQPGAYIQLTQGGVFDLTTNTGQTWAPRFKIPEEVVDLPKVAGAANAEVVYTAIREPGTTSKGYPKFVLKRTADVLGNNTPLSSNVDAFGHLGTYHTEWVNYPSYGVDPNDPNYLMVSDVDSDQVKYSTDGGATWTSDMTLTDLVTQSGNFKFSRPQGSTQTTAFGFDWNCMGHVLVGTMLAGIFETYDRGGSWQKLGNSDLIPEVSSIFFQGDQTAVISSYGRGVWRYFYTCPSKGFQIPKPLKLAEPLIYWDGGRIPISQIHDPDACPACGYFLPIGGKILDYKTDPNTGELLEVAVNGGEIKGYTWDGAELPVPFQVTQGGVQGALNSDSRLRGFLAGPTQLKGFFTEGNILRGVLLAERDLSVDQLPKKVPLAPHIALSPPGTRPADDNEPITVTGVGFDPGTPLEVLLDGQPVQPDAPPDFDPQGNFTFTLTPLVDLGVHSILVRQGDVQDISLFLVTVHEAEP